MPDDSAYATFDGIEDILSFEYIYGRGIEPGCLIVECVPQAQTPGDAGDFVIVYGRDVFTVPDIAPVDQWLEQGTVDTEDVEGPGPRMYVKLLDHRRRWKGGSITGRYNVRLPDGTIDPPTKREPSILANLCLAAMGETGYDTSRMPTGVYPTVVWDNVNPALALDYLCRYVGCEITGGERKAVVIMPMGSGDDLPAGGEYINEPFKITSGDYPSYIELEGSDIVWQAKLKLKGLVVQSDLARPITPPGAGDTDWRKDLPFSIPSLTSDELRYEALATHFRHFQVVSLADGSFNLALAPFPITKPKQFLLRDVLIETFTDLQGELQRLPARIEGLFWPYGSDADSHTSVTPFNGPFTIRPASNVIEFPYPIWKVDTSGYREEPDLYLHTTFTLKKVDGDAKANFTAVRSLGGPGSAYPLRRPELFYSIKVLYDADGITTAGSPTTTFGPASAEAERYLDIFEEALKDRVQFDVEWLEIKDIKCSGKVAQVRLRGSVRPGTPFSTRASSGFEFDVHSPTSAEQRVNRAVREQIERANP